MLVWSIYFYCVRAECHIRKQSLPSFLPIRHYKLVGDNIDMAVKAGYIQADGARNQSLHYFHSFAVKNRVNFSHIPDIHPHTRSPSHKQMAVCLLPSAEDDKKLHQLFLVHVSRIVATYLPYFKFAFENVVDWHVQHMYSNQMSQKSEVVGLIITTRSSCKT